VITNLGLEMVELNSREYNRIVVRIDAINGVAIN
jgi:hypothetical protein